MDSFIFQGKENFHKNVRFAQFYFIDTFILLCCGAEFHLLSFHLDTTKDDLKRWVHFSLTDQWKYSYSLIWDIVSGEVSWGGKNITEDKKLNKW